MSRILTDSRALVAAFAGGQARALLPLDWIRWTAETQKALVQVAARARKELKATRLELVLTGRASERVPRELPQVGWTVATAK